MKNENYLLSFFFVLEVPGSSKTSFLSQPRIRGQVESENLRDGGERECARRKHNRREVMKHYTTHTCYFNFRFTIHTPVVRFSLDRFSLLQTENQTEFFGSLNQKIQKHFNFD